MATGMGVQENVLCKLQGVDPFHTAPRRWPQALVIKMKATILLICAGAVLCPKLLGGSASGWGGHSGDDYWYRFDIKTSETDIWNWRTQELPPLSPGRAAQIAEGFMLGIVPQEQMKGWKVHSIRLELISYDKDRPRVPECWAYCVHFLGVPAEGWTGVYPQFDVIVQLDGTVANTVKGKIETSRPEPSSSLTSTGEVRRIPFRRGN